MEVLVLTIFVSVVLAMGFVLFFVWQARGGGGSDAERDSLMPLDDGPRRRTGVKPSPARSEAPVEDNQPPGKMPAKGNGAQGPGARQL